MFRTAHQRSLIPWAQAVNGVGLVLALVPWTVLAADKVPAELSASAPGGPPPAGLPRGAIVAFMQDFGGVEYSVPKGLRRWLPGQGWAICDGKIIKTR
jgi:hypothetical protein